ncbi:MAG: methylmalonyl-CoA mutase, partial [Dehalococcoidia bacterium]|nr:methylmalonyl-CoA mutase [Dehalococcoidia bacterium]
MAEMKERKREFKTTVDGIVVERVYSPDDVSENEAAAIPPGKYPFTRNIMPAGYRTRLWTMRQ